MKKERKRPATIRDEKKKQILQRLAKETVLYTKRQRSRKNKKSKPLEYAGKQIDDGLMDQPATSDHQPLPRSLREMMKAQNDMKKTKAERKALGNRKPDEEGAKKKFQRLEQLQKRKGESTWRYMARMEAVTREQIVRSQYAKKYKVDPNVMHVKKKKGKKAKRMLNRLKESKKKKMEFIRDKGKSGFEHLRDDVKFGEVVKAPPKFTATPKGKNR